MPDIISTHLGTVIGLAVMFLHALGVLSACHAMMSPKTSQGAIAWALPLVIFPYIALPLYWMFGRDKFQGYTQSRRQGLLEIHAKTIDITNHQQNHRALDNDASYMSYNVLEKMAQMPFTHGNEVEILMDGDATFSAIFKAISEAQKYIFIEFFIIHDDNLGRELKKHLLARAAEGVKICVVYDEIGSYKLPRGYINELQAAGVEIFPFNTRKGVGNRFQINFRNHRKIVVVDGKVGFVGGLNVGDEYMGRDPKFGHWRDTHTRVTGPAVQQLQLTFLEDWYWASHRIPEADWKITVAEQANLKTLVLPTGPADELDTCSLFFTLAIHSAKKRIWIVSPYFIPSMEVSSALQLAALRGVDVRIMLPEKPDHLMVYYASFAYMARLNIPGIRFYRYLNGFLHQKVILVDDDWSSIGTANADTRSFHLNFEVTLVVNDAEFTKRVEAMLEEDFSYCRQVSADDYYRLSIPQKIFVNFSRLLSPIL